MNKNNQQGEVEDGNWQREKSETTTKILQQAAREKLKF
jgi:hypothetical protein